MMMGEGVKWRGEGLTMELCVWRRRCFDRNCHNCEPNDLLRCRVAVEGTDLPMPVLLVPPHYAISVDYEE